MSYTYNDFVMESAMVETTNDTEVSDIQMEQMYAEFNVAVAAYKAFSKYSVISEYANCDVEEFIQESLDDKINKVEDWKNSGGKMKKIAGTVAAGALKIWRAIANFFKNLFSKENNPFAKLSRKIKAIKEKNAKATTDAEVDAITSEINANEKQMKKGKKFSLFIKKTKVPVEQYNQIIRDFANQKLTIDQLERQVKSLLTKITEQEYIIKELEDDKKKAQEQIKTLRTSGMTVKQKKEANARELARQEKEAAENAEAEAEAKRFSDASDATLLIINLLQKEGASLSETDRNRIFELFVTSEDSATNVFKDVIRVAREMVGAQHKGPDAL